MTDETFNLATDTARAQELLTKWHETDLSKISDITEMLDALRTETLDAAALRGAQAAQAFIDNLDEENELNGDDFYDHVFSAIREEAK